MGWLQMSGWDFQTFSQTICERRFSPGNKGKEGRNLSSQTWPENPNRSPPRHPQPHDKTLLAWPVGLGLFDVDGKVSSMTKMCHKNA